MVCMVAWGSQKALHEKNRGRQQRHHGHRQQGFSCMSNFREPVSRLKSCLYFRFLNDPHYTKASGCIDKLSVSQLINLISKEVDHYSNSCINEPFRILSGFLDEDIINSIGLKVRGQSAIEELLHLSPGRPDDVGSKDPVKHTNLHHHHHHNRTSSTSGNSHSLHEVEGLLDLSSGTVAPEPHLSALSAHIFNVTLMDRMTKCVPFILEYPESIILLGKKFPSLQQNGAFGLTSRGNSGRYRACPPPSPEQMVILQKFTALERVLYDAVLAKTKQAYEDLMLRE